MTLHKSITTISMNRKVRGSPTLKIEVAFIFPVIKSPKMSGDLKEKGEREIILVVHQQGEGTASP